VYFILTKHGLSIRTTEKKTVPRAFGIAAGLRGVGLLFNKSKYLLADPMTFALKLLFN
jgi:hypothetical protein